MQIPTLSGFACSREGHSSGDHILTNSPQGASAAGAEASLGELGPSLMPDATEI